MSERPPASELARVRSRAERLASPAEIDAAVDRMAEAITARLGATNPVLLAVMTGGAVPLALLLQRLDFPLEVDYVHLSRYGRRTTGGALHWLKQPPAAVTGRTVLVVDDILDHGVTLAAVHEECHRRGAHEVLSAVLVTKTLGARSGLAATDFSALSLPDRYLFGYGMDYKGYLRNAPGIFAVSDES